MEPTTPDPTKLRHDQSVKQYPHLNLSDSEYVIVVVRRHWMALIGPMIIGVILLVVLWAIQVNYDVIVQQLNITGIGASSTFLLMPIILVTILVLIGEGAVYYVYDNNRLFVTNESLIQEIQFSLLAKREQVIGLENVAEVSFLKSGAFSYIFNYGTIRMSTVGDEQAYTQPYVPNPQFVASTITNTVEVFKRIHPEVLNAEGRDSSGSSTVST